MSTIQETVRLYLDSFNDRDGKSRQATLEEIYTDDCTYTDPHVSLSGRKEIDAFVASVHERLPKVKFSLAGEVDAHHDQARFTWHAGLEGEKPMAVGFDVVVLEKGRIRSVFGFLEAAK